MNKFPEVYHLDSEITIDEFVEEKHSGKIFCPECKIAPMHIVIKQIINPYFASNSKQAHHKDCQFYEEFIENVKLRKLINSNNVDDKDRLDFLITSNLAATMRLLLNEDSGDSTINHSFNSNQSSTKQGKNKGASTYKKESIPRVHITRLKKKAEYINTHIIIYGTAELDVKLFERKDKYTNEDYITKQLLFRQNNDLKFSVFLNKYKTMYFNTESGSVKFAIFGELVKNKEFLNLNVDHTRNINVELE